MSKLTTDDYDLVHLDVLAKRMYSDLNEISRVAALNDMDDLEDAIAMAGNSIETLSNIFELKVFNRMNDVGE